MAELRQRKDPTKPDPADSGAKPVPAEKALTPNQLAKAEDSSFSLLDVARLIVFIILSSSLVSYFVTRESFTWNLDRPKWTRPDVIKTWIAGPKQLTDADLAAYDGSDLTKPIYLAINGTIYDVSAGARHYGPGGSYHFFAGCDASRGFVTSCFDEDRNPDLRGVELMYIPKDDPEVDRAGEAEGEGAVHAALKHWVDFFANSGKYAKVGNGEEGARWEKKGPVPKLCKKAEDGRPQRRKPPPKE
ncbi:hypothetical protein B0O99DRAFT_649297 [Bisporella sp. PMI_857]|nr:hypothetical protein B0O99DRAFT_682740 [Bisporella sp. PMI_857]KAH8600560.1 hypothetical protein B0O99DRAFT_649297 [Bisporella sp. PMI_857]